LYQPFRIIPRIVAILILIGHLGRHLTQQIAQILVHTLPHLLVRLLVVLIAAASGGGGRTGPLLGTIGRLLLHHNLGTLARFTCGRFLGSGGRFGRKPFLLVAAMQLLGLLDQLLVVPVLDVALQMSPGATVTVGRLLEVTIVQPDATEGAKVGLDLFDPFAAHIDAFGFGLGGVARSARRLFVLVLVGCGVLVGGCVLIGRFRVGRAFGLVGEFNWKESFV
jgi:hypothetical protein